MTIPAGKKKIILSGMRPTGRLHIGHYVGALENWVGLQDEFQNYHLVADYHVLTTNPDSSQILENTIEMVKDWLAAGLDPEKSPIFRQSQIKEHCELHLIFSMLVTTARLERNPTLKEQIRDLNIKNTIYGHLGYPVLQSSDILLYKGNFVPVGEDQVPHVEISREIARSFNNTYGEVFPEPQAKLTRFARLPGLDMEAKMSKSLGNAIELADPPDEVLARIKTAFTDPTKIRKDDPGHPDGCAVYHYHTRFNAEQEPVVRQECLDGARGCVACKQECAGKVSEFLAPMQEKRRHFDEHPDEVMDVLLDGEKRARAVAQATMEEVRAAMKMG
jgi:tryptophanyl-tRNA synthetase